MFCDIMYVEDVRNSSHAVSPGFLGNAINTDFITLLGVSTVVHFIQRFKLIFISRIVYLLQILLPYFHLARPLFLSSCFFYNTSNFFVKYKREVFLLLILFILHHLTLLKLLHRKLIIEWNAAFT